jgi:hypothetical protein
MASNKIPGSLKNLFHLASTCKSGATTLGAGIPLVLNTAGVIGSARGNAVQLQFVYRTSISQLPDIRLGVKNARRDGRAFATKARNWLENTLGSTHTLAWSAVGFDNGSLEIPKDDAGLESLLERMYFYL